MPTARPSIAPRTGAICWRSSQWVRARAPSRLTPTPVKATASGMPAITREPSITIRTTAATPTPMASPIPPTSVENTSSWP